MLTLSMPVWAVESFHLIDLDGKIHLSSDYKGKWIFVNFWATWCPPCLEEIPDLIALQDQHKKKLIVIGIALDYKNKQEVIKFADDNLINYPLVLGDEKLIHQIGSADVLPSTYIYNPLGKLVKIHRGLLNRDTVEKLLLEK